MKTIAVIGAGWAGISCLRQLLKDGHQVDVYERYDDIGGVWHPNNTYISLRTHSQALTIEFPDFLLPKEQDRFARMPAKQVYEYLKAYCKDKGLDKHIKKNHTVLKINYVTVTNKLYLYYLDTKTNEQGHQVYDYIVNTTGWNQPNMPDFPNQDKFKGEIIHAYQANENKIKEMIKENKKIIIIGAGKAATDMILAFRNLNYPVTWLFRKHYWFWNFSMQDRYYRKKFTAIERLKFKLSLMLGFFFVIRLPNSMANFGFNILKSQKIIHIAGEPHDDYKKFHHGRLDEEQIEMLRTAPNQICSEIKSFSENSALLMNGDNIDADVILCCTGSSPKKFLIDLEIDGNRFDIEKSRRMYRYCVSPEIPHLIMTFYTLFSFGMVNCISRALWISRYIKKDYPYEMVNAESHPINENYFNGLFNSDTYFVKRIESHIDNYARHGDLSKSNFVKYSLAQYFKDYLFPLNFK